MSVETLQERSDLTDARVAGNVIRGARIVGPGREKECTPAALSQLGEMLEGRGINADAPRSGETVSYRNRVGFLRGVKVESDAVIRADVVLNPHHPLAEQLLWDAQNRPKSVALVLNATGKAARRNGRIVVNSFETVRGIDLTAEPEAVGVTTGLFESYCMSMRRPTTPASPPPPPPPPEEYGGSPSWIDNRPHLVTPVRFADSREPLDPEIPTSYGGRSSWFGRGRLNLTTPGVCSF